MASRARLGALFPIVQSKGTLDQSGMLRLGAFLLAIDEINNSSELLPSIQLDFVLRDSRRDGLSALVGALELLEITVMTLFIVGLTQILRVNLPFPLS